MKLRTYQAWTMAEALAAVKQHLGDDAVILHTRTFKRRSLMGLRARTLVEVTATPAPARDGALRERPRDRVAAAPSAASRALAARRAYLGGSSAGADGAARAALLEPPPRPAAPVMVAPPPPRERPSVVESRPAPRPAMPRAEEAPGGAMPRRFILQPELATAGLSIAPAAAVAVPLVDAMQEELAAIRRMVGAVLQRSRTRGPVGPGWPAPLFEAYLQLLGQDLEESLVDDIVHGVRDDLSTAELEDAGAVRSAVRDRLVAIIPVADDPVAARSPDGRPLVVALVGPTGVGKTTTLAKIAASFKLRHGRRVGLVTADTYRIAAVDQLRTYANIIGLPLQVALTPAEMRQAIHGLGDRDVVLIDTAGRIENDAARIDELRTFLGAAEPHEVHLVLSSTAGEKVLRQEAEAFGAVGVDKVVLTKVDEAVGFGMAVSAIRTLGRPFSFFTTGQEVPDHLEQGCARRLAELMLGGAVHP